MGVLEECFITEDSPTPLCQQFDALVDRIVYALDDAHPDIYNTIRDLKMKGEKEFMPDKDKFIEEEALVEKFLEGTEKKEFLLEMYGDALERAYESYDEYTCGINKLYFIIREQLDENIALKLKLKMRESRDEVRYDTIEMLKSLRDICYDINVRRVHPALDNILKIQQFVSCKQKKGQRVDDYVAEVQSYYNVLKLTGGASNFRSPLIEDTIEKEFPQFKDVEYASLSDKDKERVDDRADERVVAFVIVQGSKSSWKNSLILHFAEVAGVRYNERTRQYEDRK